jgi:cytosine/adenosine deaminase-related metal-dependent hydrolase
MSILLGPDNQGKTLVTAEGRIAYFGEDARPTQSVDTALDCHGCHLEPGRVNAHTHIYSGLAPLGMPEPDVQPENFVQILERIWWRLDRALDEESLRASARYYAAESLLAGTTTLIDHHESPNFIDGSLDVLADACQEIGIRAVLCYGATERNCGRQEARRGLAECRRFARTNDRPLIQGVVALHASFTVSDETIAEAAEVCRDLDTVMHVHVSEDLADVADAKERGYDGPLERLLDFEALPAGSILAHCVHCGATQVSTANGHGLWIVQNPRSNRGNRVGYPTALGASARVALGTDGYPSDMGAEALVLEQEAAAHGEDPAVVRRRLTGGHILAGERLETTLAPLAPDHAADVVALENGRARHVVVDGNLVVQDGRLMTADLEEIHARAKEQAPGLWARMESY